MRGFVVRILKGSRMSQNEIVVSQGLKRNMLSRYAKKWHLRENYKMTQQERDALLDELYGPEELFVLECWH
jgi:hypothetical protein